MLRLLAITGLVLLAGCAGNMNPPPSTPTLTQIAAQEQALLSSGIPPAAYVNIGTTLESQQCNGWFSTQIAGAQQTSLAQGALGLGSGAIALAEPHAAAAAGALGLLSALLGNNQANSPVGNDPTGAYILVNKTLQAWQSAAQNPQSIEDAYALVESYSELCQLPGIQSAIRMAVMTAPVTALPSGALSSHFNSAAPQRVLPPVVVVGTPPPGPATLTPPQEDIPAPAPRQRRRARSQVTSADERVGREWLAIEREGRAAYERHHMILTGL